MYERKRKHLLLSRNNRRHDDTHNDVGTQAIHHKPHMKRGLPYFDFLHSAMFVLLVQTSATQHSSCVVYWSEVARITRVPDKGKELYSVHWMWKESIIFRSLDLKRESVTTLSQIILVVFYFGFSLSLSHKILSSSFGNVIVSCLLGGAIQTCWLVWPSCLKSN